MHVMTQRHIASVCTYMCVCVWCMGGGVGWVGGMWLRLRGTVQVAFEWDKPLTRRNNDDMTKASHRLCRDGTRVLPRVS